MMESLVKGIRYRTSTGGKMRFMAPAKPASWPGVRDCVAFGHQSPQNMNYVEVLAPRPTGPRKDTTRIVYL